MAPKYRATLLTDQRFDDWTAFVEQSPQGSIYSTPAYLHALTQATGGRYRVLAVERGSEIVAGIALYEEDTPGGTIVSPRLLLYYNGVVLRSLDSRYPYKATSEWIRVAGELVDWLAEAGYGRTTLKALPGLDDVRAFQARGWRTTPTYSYVVPVHDLDSTWSRIDQNLRRLVSRGEKEGISAAEDGDFESFYRLHADTMARKDQATYLPQDRFRGFVQTLRDQGLAALYHARLPNGQAIATALVLLGNHPVAHTVTAAADPEYQGLGTNVLLRWSTFQDLHARGYRGVDLTDAAMNAVTRFKSQLGGDLTLALEVDAPRSPGYTGWVAGRERKRRLRGLVGAGLRRVLPGRGA